MVIVTKCYLGDQIRAGDVGGGSCGVHWERGFVGGSLEERDDMEEHGVGGRIILKLTLKLLDW